MGVINAIQSGLFGCDVSWTKKTSWILSVLQLKYGLKVWPVFSGLQIYFIKKLQWKWTKKTFHLHPLQVWTWPPNTPLKLWLQKREQKPANLFCAISVFFSFFNWQRPKRNKNPRRDNIVERIHYNSNLLIFAFIFYYASRLRSGKWRQFTFIKMLWMFIASVVSAFKLKRFAICVEKFLSFTLVIGLSWCCSQEGTIP